MSNNPVQAQKVSRTSILRQAKEDAAQLRAALKEGRDPTAPEVEGLRRALRDRYLSFLFAGRSLSARAGDVVNLLWLECSHALIKRHRDRITKVDAEIDRSAHLSRKQRTDAYKSSGEGTGARRKLVHGLRAFLTQEEGFWASLIGRIIETFHVDRARPAAAFLKLYAMPEMPNQTAKEQEGEHALGLVQTALVFYGDLARYSELYRDAGNKERRFERAAECYHQARLLMPWSGQPDHQLAVIASGRKDRLAAAFHYMRALAVRSSFAMARPNLETTYKQALIHFKTSAENDESELGDIGAQTSNTFIVIMASMVLEATKVSKEELVSLMIKFNRQMISALETRALTSENIIKILLLAISTWWDARLSDDASRGSAKRNEDQLLEVVLDILISLFSISASMTEASLEASLPAAARSGDPASALAARISAPVRRIAPSLRIASLWILGNLEQIGRSANKEKFWLSYSRVVNSFVAAYPLDLLPTLPSGCNLEEDFELLSFLPCPLPPGSAAAPYIADHPNSEFLFRIQGFVSDATLASQQPAHQQVLSDALGAQVARVDPGADIANEDDADLLAEAMDAARLSSAYQIEEEDEDDEVLYNPHAARRMPSPFAPVGPSPGVSAPTAHDLLSNLLRGDTALPSQPNIWGSNATSQIWGGGPAESSWQQPQQPPPATTTWKGDIWQMQPHAEG